MSMPIDTAKVTGRRSLRFERIDDILADVERLSRSAQLRALGNWPPGQVVNHLATVMNKSMDGFTNPQPALVRFIVRLLFKKRFLSRTMDAGFKLPARLESELVLPPISLEEAVANFRQAFDRLQKESQRRPHPALGKLTCEEWNQVHCRHSELHLSFLIP